MRAVQADDPAVLLLFHRKLQMWLPPGGHIENNELPDDAAIREVLEETGVRVRLVGECQPARSAAEPRLLVRPEGVQVENIGPNHQHIDFIYFAVPEDIAQCGVIETPEVELAGWYPLSELHAMGVRSEVRNWAEVAGGILRQRMSESRSL